MAQTDKVILQDSATQTLCYSSSDIDNRDRIKRTSQ